MIQKKAARTRGFTLVELLVVIGIIAIAMAAAVPSFIQWREGLRYREVCKGIATTVRTMRSTAISTNRQVELELSGNRYRMGTGDRALASTLWSHTTWTTLPTGVALSAPNSRIIANPNGTLFFTGAPHETAVFSSASASLAVSVQNISTAPAVNKYSIVLAQTGRISVTLVN